MNELVSASKVQIGENKFLSVTEFKSRQSTQRQRTPAFFPDKEEFLHAGMVDGQV